VVSTRVGFASASVAIKQNVAKIAVGIKFLIAMISITDYFRAACYVCIPTHRHVKPPLPSRNGHYYLNWLKAFRLGRERLSPRRLVASDCRRGGLWRRVELASDERYSF
jgi:hypothetical protein